MTDYEFWKRLQDVLGVEDEEKVHKFGERVLETLSARLTYEEAEDLKAQLPHGLKEIWERHEHEMHKLDREQFAEKIRTECDLADTEQAEDVIRAVFGVLQEGISPGEARDVEAQLPGDLKPLWEFATSSIRVESRKERRTIIY